MSSVKAKKGYMTIPQAAIELDCQVAYVRTLLRESKVEGAVKRPLNDKQWRWEIPITWIQQRKDTQGTRSKRDDGRNRVLVWMNPGEITKFTTLMQENLPDVPWEMAYKRTTQPFVEEEEEEEEDV